MSWIAGQSAVIVPVPDADSIVEGWRARYDRSAPLGVPAHVTVVVPFVPEPLLTGDVIGELAVLVQETGAIEASFRGFAEFPGVLYMEPEPAEAFVGLTRRLMRRWPEYPPYEGQFGDDPIPHLTVAETPDPVLLDAIRADVSRHLPFQSVLAMAWLMTFDGHRWNLARELPLAPLA
jgi:hypothetical protein